MITRVTVDSDAFLTSFFATLTRQGAATESLSHYEVLAEDGAEYLFSDYNQVPDFAIP